MMTRKHLPPSSGLSDCPPSNLVKSYTPWRSMTLNFGSCACEEYTTSLFINSIAIWHLRGKVHHMSLHLLQKSAVLLVDISFIDTLYELCSARQIISNVCKMNLKARKWCSLKAHSNFSSRMGLGKVDQNVSILCRRLRLIVVNLQGGISW